jgi:hypothetical protein
MEMFDSVVVAYGPCTFDLAMPIRAMLELFRLRVHTYYCCQKQNLLDVLAGQVPDTGYVVLVLGGGHDEDLERGGCISCRELVEPIAGEWRATDVKLFPEDIRRTVNLPGRTVLCVGCHAGIEPLAKAFIESGCRAYIAPTESIDQNSTTMFVCAFFHYLMAEPPDRMTEREAVERARNIDSQTASYRYYPGVHAGHAK